MSDYDDDYNDDIDYNPDEYEEPDNNNLNLEDMYIEAENNDDIDLFKQIIELERDNSSTHNYSFRSSEKICLICLKKKDIETFSRNFEKLINLYSKVDECYRIDTVRKINFVLSDLNDNQFSIKILNFMFNHLIQEDIEREILNTGLQLAKNLFITEKDEELGKVILLSYIFFHTII
jgi:hypothetical protein